jgi:hypothetical protein
MTRLEEKQVRSVRHLFSNLIILLNIIVMAFFSLFIFWMVYPYKIVTFKTKEHKILTPIVKRGENLAYIADRCKFMPLVAKVSRVFVNDLEFPVTGFTYSKVDLGCLSQTIYYTVPKELPVGNYSLKTIYQYLPNPIRNIDYVVFTERFTVIE